MSRFNDSREPLEVGCHPGGLLWLSSDLSGCHSTVCRHLHSIGASLGVTGGHADLPIYSNEATGPVPKG
ncbi:hypothetical protein RUM43_007020 [Polyplax serrata]|uniref:Uncharacterized protein n=1 Tax=Polyplax serrata TaxID=468196 RepID=A0AAN8PWH1_POLSC